MFLIYNQFVSINNEISKNITNKILARTKKLTLSSKKYNNYLESFSDVSQEKINFLQTEYNLPIITPKKLNMKKKSFSRSRKTLTPKMNKTLLANYNINNHINRNNKDKEKNASNKTLQNKNINFFICDFDYSNKEEQKNNKISNNINKYKYYLTQQNFIKFKTTSKNKKKIKENDKNNIKIIKNEEKASKKQIFCLLDSVFSEDKKDKNKNSDLIYEEKEIFGYKNLYLDYLKNEIKSLIKKEKEINMNYNINYIYNNKIYGKIVMEINSAKVEVFDKMNDSLCSTVNIPFSLLCIFYLSTVKQLSHIIINIFKNDYFLNNEKKSDEKIKIFFEEIISNQILFKNNDLIFKNNFEDEDKDNILSDYIKYRNLKYRTNVRYNILLINKKEEALKKILFENCTFNNYRSSDLNFDFNQKIYNKNTESMKNLFDSNINIIHLSWITLDKNYLIKITMPHIAIKLTNYQKQINHFISKEIFVFLYKNNFKNWNFYISHYLFSLKKFRICINNILSYYSLLNMLNKNKAKTRKHFSFNNYKLNITEIENEKKKLYKNINNVNNKNINDTIIYKQYYLSNLKFEYYENSLNDNEYIFFVSDDEFIHLYKMKSYVLFGYLFNDLKQPIIYYFDFSFYEMMILFYKSKYENLVQFLQRLIKVNKKKKKIYLDYCYFNSFQLMNNKQIDHHFKESYLIENFNKNNLMIDMANKNKLNNNNNTVSNNDDSTNKIVENELILKISNPKFISVSIKKNDDINNNEGRIEEKWIKKEGEIGRQLIEKLVENDIKEWGTILWQNKDSIEALKNSKGLGKRRVNIFKDKQDFKTVFKKFLNIK